MLIVKRMYFVLAIMVIAFLAFQCGENKDNQGQENNPRAESSSNNKTTLLKGNPAEGKMYFDQTCSACHGMDAKGLPKLGKDLTTSKFVSESTDKEMLSFIKQGRLPTDPLNTTGVAMPPKGGNPALTDQQLMDIISYLKTLNKK